MTLLPTVKQIVTDLSGRLAPGQEWRWIDSTRDEVMMQMMGFPHSRAYIPLGEGETLFVGGNRHPGGELQIEVGRGGLNSTRAVTIQFVDIGTAKAQLLFVMKTSNRGGMTRWVDATFEAADSLWATSASLQTSQKGGSSPPHLPVPLMAQLILGRYQPLEYIKAPSNKPILPT